MATAKGPQRPEGVILFSLGEFSYAFLRELDRTNHGETVMLVQRRARLGPEGNFIVRALPPALPGHDSEALARIRARLEEEARLAAYLDHPNIPCILGRAEIQGVLYVLSERVPGTTLDTYVTAAVMSGVCLSAAFALYVGAEVASALHHAHTRTDEDGRPLGIIHRDVNPARIYLRPDGRIRLADFALARSLLPGRVATSLPRPQGDAYYAAPEALLGEPMDARSDLFALGLVLLELVTAKGIYSTPTLRASDLEKALTPELRAQVVAAHTTATLAELPAQVDDYILRAATYGAQDVEALTEEVFPPLRSILRSLLQRRPEDRSPSAAALEEALREGLAAWGASYGAAEAIAEARAVASRARLHRDVGGPIAQDSTSAPGASTGGRNGGC
ncbi:serine/threonine-protein kinase [Hyalangium sp.]|uniref:serine/threonine-protein kinase n=1 Tax=Hyalangium sp. TaxID=2028555 RepID=UPI002D6AC581|nr:serine/threonine-protein kinase [Hyalangium sp.]HYI00683.1 serine/threonine-protein kinase [Hyalangium sp.]